MEVAQKGGDVGSNVGQQSKRVKRKKRKMVPLREDQIKQITKIDEATGKEKVIEEISLLDSDDEEEQAREAEEKEPKVKNTIELHDLYQKDAGRKYYKRFTLDGGVYGLGDAVVLHSGEERGNFVGIIEDIFRLKTILPIKKEGAKHQPTWKPRKKKFKIKVRWFYQKFDIDDRRRDYKIPIPRKGFPGVATAREEVYWSFDQDINDMTSVLCPAHIIYCPAATDPRQMAALCQKEPNTFFCRYIYYNTKFYHINSFAEDWGIDDERRYEVQALYQRLLEEGVEFPAHAESQDSDSGFDFDADSCTSPLGNGETYILSDAPLDDDEEAEANEGVVQMEPEEQEGQGVKGSNDDDFIATNKRKRAGQKGKEKVTDNGKRRKSADAGMPVGDGVRLENIVPERAASVRAKSPPASSSPSSSPSSFATSLEVKQQLLDAAKADEKRRKLLEKQALQETKERREVNKRRQQQLDDEMKKLSLRPRKNSIGESILIDAPDYLPLDTDASTLPPRLRRRRTSQDADSSGEEIALSFRKKAAGATPASGASGDSDNEPLDLSDRAGEPSADAGAGGGDGWGGNWDSPAPSGANSTSDSSARSTSGGDGWGASFDAAMLDTVDMTSEPSARVDTSGSDWGSSWGDEPAAGGSSASGTSEDAGWGSSWGDEPTASGSSAATGSSGGGDWGDDWNDAPSTQPASSAGSGSTSWAGLIATHSTEDSISSGHWADAGGGGSEYRGGGGGGMCYKCHKPGHFARECTEAGTSASGPLPEIGSTCPAKVMSVGKKDGRAFGVFVRPDGCCQDGLVHFTRMLRRRVEPDDEDLLELVGGVGATVNVKVLDIEEENGRTRLKLSMKDADHQPSSVDASRGSGGTCFKCGKSGHFARECPGVASSEQGFGGGHGSDATAANREWNSAGSIDQHSSSGSGASSGTGFTFMHPERARALGLASASLSASAPQVSSSAPSALSVPNFPGTGGGYERPAYDQQPQQPQQQYQPQQPMAGVMPHFTFVMPPQSHVGYQPPQGYNAGWAGLNSIPAPPQPHPQPYASSASSASSASAAASSSLLSPTLTEEEEAELATVPYDLTTLNQARLGRMTMMRWFRRYRRRFNVKYLEGLLVRVLLNRQGYVGEIVGVVRSEPYYLSSGYELVIPPEDPAQLAQALNDRALIRVTFKLMVEIPGVDEGREFPAYAISSNFFSHQEMVQWLLGRKAMRRDPLTLEELEAKKRIIAKARAKSDAAADHRRQHLHRKTSLDLSALPSLGQAVSQNDKEKEQEKKKDEDEDEDGAAMATAISSGAEPEPLTAPTTSATFW